MNVSKGRINTYEAMFLFPQGPGNDLHNVLMTLNTIFERSGCEVIALERWDERRLAYEIAKHKRGIYFLSYFRCDPVNLVGFERDCNLSEDILRFMITKADHLTEEEMRLHDQRGRLGDEAQLRADDVPTLSADMTPHEPEPQPEPAGVGAGAAPEDEATPENEA
ncbi:MAG: 30S ribosomal protein S6 [Planctomycetota bacterium]